MSLRLATRPNAVLSLLAVAAFAAALALANRDRMPWAGSAMAGADSAPSTAGAGANETGNTGSRASSRARIGAPSSQVAAAQRRDPTPEQLQTVARLSEEVMPREETTAEHAERRGDAIRQLGTLPGPQAAEALIHATRNDVDPRNRILAIEALRRAGAAGDANWVIRDALRDASTSSDEVIAAQARAAYDELVAKLGTERH